MARLGELPVVVPESDVSAGLQDLAVLQPGELRLGLALGLAGECGSGADGPSHRLGRLAELCRSWKGNRGWTRQVVELK